MVVYVEYAFLENFLLDGVLLWLSLFASKTPVRWGRLVLSAAIGGGFALLFPLLRISVLLALLLKISIGGLLPMLCFKRLKNKKEWGRYALSASFFFAFTFAFGGALLGGATTFSLRRLPRLVVWIGFAFFTACTLFFLVKFYQKRADYRHIYECAVIFDGKRVKGKGLWDSGNRARKNGVPVCFLSADIFYELIGEKWIFERKEIGQVCDEMQITTQAGTRKLLLYKGSLQIENREEKEVYFALSTNMISREYKILLHSSILEGEERWAA